MRVPIYERKQSIAPLSGGEVKAVAPAGDYGAEAAKTANAFLLKFQQIQDDTEDARTLELLNQFKADSNNYHENPDSGAYNTKLGINAQGFYSEADKWLRERGEKYAQGLKSERAKKNFRDKALEYINQKGVQNSRFEADQVKKYQTEQADATYKNGLNEIGLNPYDEDFVNSTKQTMTDALELMLRYASPEKKKEALAGLENDVASARFDAIYQQDADAAEKFFQANKGLFTADTAQKAEKKLERSRVQKDVDMLAEYYPEGHEQEALKYIRENFSGEREDAIAAAYKTRINENTIREANAEKELRKTQKKYKEDILKKLLTGEELPTEEELASLVANDLLSYADYQSIQKTFDASSQRANIEKRLYRSNPNISQHDLDIAVMQEMGTTLEDYQTHFAYAAKAYMDGDIKQTELKDMHKRGLLPLNDVNRIIKNVDTWDDAQKAHFKTESAALKEVVKKLKDEANLPTEYALSIMNDFTNKAIETLNPRSPKYREELQQLKRDAVLDALNNAGVKLTDWSLFGGSDSILGMFGTKNTKAGDIYSALQGETLKARGISEQPNIQELKPQELPLRHKGETSGFNPVSMVSGGKITSKYNPKRKISPHYAVDIGGKAGTDIKMPDFGIPLKVTGTTFKPDEDNLGVSMKLEGTYPNGDKIQVILGHMQEDSMNFDVKDTVNAGDIVGKVGNTGRTGNEAKGVGMWYEGKDYGYHLHLGIKINGKPVNPEKWTPPVTTKAPTPTKQDTEQLEKKPKENWFDFMNEE